MDHYVKWLCYSHSYYQLELMLVFRQSTCQTTALSPGNGTKPLI